MKMRWLCKLDPVQSKINVEESLNKLQWRRIMEKRKEKEVVENSMEKTEFNDITEKKVNVNKITTKKLPLMN